MSTPTDPPLSRRAARHAEQSAQDAQQQAFARPEQHGGRSAPISVPSSPPSDVSYRTQVRPRVPHYDAPPAAHTVIPGAAPSAAPPVAPPATEAPMRRRDFRPPAEQTAPTHHATPPVGAPGQTAPSGTPLAGHAGFDAELDYRTQLAPRPDAVVAPTQPPAAPGPFVVTPVAAQVPPVVHVVPAPSAPVAPAQPVEQTLSRREMRALRDQSEPAAEQAPPPLVAPQAPPPGTPPAPQVVAPPPSAPIGQPAPAPLGVPSPSVHVSAEPAFVPPVVPVPLAEPAAVPMPTVGSPMVGSAPTGSHWSVGIHADDDPFENTFSREVGSTSAGTSTSALVLPEMPMGSLSGPVTGTGEIIITGMIDLPRTVSSTGTVPTVHDSPDIDDLFDAGDLTPAPADAAPVSASRAVSSHTQGHSIITPSSRRPSSNTVTTVLVAATVVMAVVAIGLFVVAAVNGLF